MTAVLEKDALASRPTLSRFFNRMDEDTLRQLNQIIRELRKVIYFIKNAIFPHLYNIFWYNKDNEKPEDRGINQWKI